MAQTYSKIFRSRLHNTVAGVCSGIALSKGWPVSLTRLATLLIICSTGFGLLLYIIFWILLPKWDAQILGPEPTHLPHDELTRDPQNKMVAGVCAAVANYFRWDPALVRIAFALFVILGGVGIVPYIYAWIVIPQRKPDAVVV